MATAVDGGGHGEVKRDEHSESSLYARTCACARCAVVRVCVCAGDARVCVCMCVYVCTRTVGSVYTSTAQLKRAASHACDAPCSSFHVAQLLTGALDQ